MNDTNVDKNINLKAFQVLNDILIADTRQVETIYKDYDNLQENMFLDPSLNFNSDLKSFFLLYQARENHTFVEFEKQ